MNTPIRAARAVAAPVELLAADEPAAVSVLSGGGATDFVFACDHAGAAIPRSLGGLGLSDSVLGSHVACDIGIAETARLLADKLDAALVMQHYSRLVIDCGRAQGTGESIIRRAEWVPIASNESLEPEQLQARNGEVFDPYHAALDQLLSQRERSHRGTLLVSLFSFPFSYRNAERPWHIAVAYARNTPLPKALLTLLQRDKRLQVADNEARALSEHGAFTRERHGEARGLQNLALGIRQDLIADEAGQKNWSGRLTSLLKEAARMAAA